MSGSSIQTRISKPWKYGLIGGLTSIPLTLGNYWLSGNPNYFSLNMVFFGDLLAGYLTKHHAGESGPAGLRAGLVGGLPAIVWIGVRFFHSTSEFAAAWDFAPAVVLAILSGGFLVGICGLGGHLGGRIGGWLAGKIDYRRILPIET